VECFCSLSACAAAGLVEAYGESFSNDPRCVGGVLRLEFEIIYSNYKPQ